MAISLRLLMENALNGSIWLDDLAREASIHLVLLQLLLAGQPVNERSAETGGSDEHETPAQKMMAAAATPTMFDISCVALGLTNIIAGSDQSSALLKRTGGRD
jgi:hypothetical protein